MFIDDYLYLVSNRCQYHVRNISSKSKSQSISEYLETEEPNKPRSAEDEIEDKWRAIMMTKRKKPDDAEKSNEEKEIINRS
jgi:hypothetical protein